MSTARIWGNRDFTRVIYEIRVPDKHIIIDQPVINFIQEPKACSANVSNQSEFVLSAHEIRSIPV